MEGQIKILSPEDIRIYQESNSIFSPEHIKIIFHPNGEIIAYSEYHGYIETENLVDYPFLKQKYRT